MEKNENIKTISIKVISYTGKTYDIIADENFTFNELKMLIIEQDDDLPDFNIIYNGRVIRKMDEIINKVIDINSENPTIYLNAAQVHGGCMPKCG